MKNDKRQMTNATSGGYNQVWLVLTQAVAFNILAPIYFLTNATIFLLALSAYVLILAMVVPRQEMEQAPSRRLEILIEINRLHKEAAKLDPKYENIEIWDRHQVEFEKLWRELEALPRFDEYEQTKADIRSRVAELTSHLKPKPSPSLAHSSPEIGMLNQ